MLTYFAIILYVLELLAELSDALSPIAVTFVELFAVTMEEKFASGIAVVKLIV